MGFFDKIKNIFNNAEKKAFIKVDFEQAMIRLENYKKENDLKKNNLKKICSERINKFCNEIEEKALLIEKINLDGRKEHEKIKLIVKDNLSLYSRHLKKFLDNLKKIEEEELEIFIEKIFSAFDEFEKSSRLSFEKATILVGEELEKTSELIIECKRELYSLYESNKEIFDESLKIKELIRKTEEMKKEIQYYEEIKNIIDNLKKDIEKMREEITKNEKNILELKKSEDYVKAMNAREEKERELSRINEELLKIKQKIDFKMLIRHFHLDKKKNLLIKKYSDNFFSSLEEDESFEICELVKESQKLNIENLKLLMEKKKNLKSYAISDIEKEIYEKEEENNKINYKIKRIEEEISQNIKKREKIFFRQKKNFEEIEVLLKKIFPNIVLEKQNFQ